MGGNALKTVETVRLSKKHAMQVWSTLRIVLNAVLLETNIQDSQIRAVKSYTEKHEFGDLDILIPVSYLQQHGKVKVLQQIAVLYGNVPMVDNGTVFTLDEVKLGKRVLSVKDVLSIGWPIQDKWFQVDIIPIEDEIFDFAENYFAFNDLGNLIGRIAHKFGLKFGHDGLWLPVRDTDNQVRQVKVSNDWEKSLTFLGFDCNKYAQGFDTLNDIFEFVVDSKYFQREIYPLEALNHKQRIRDRKRKTYNEFLKYLDTHKEIQSKFEFPKDKSVWLPKIFEVFPEALSNYDQLKDHIFKLKIIKTKYNGQLVREWTGLSDKELGRLMRSFMGWYLTVDMFNAFLLSRSELEIKNSVLATLDTLNTYSPNKNREEWRKEFCLLCETVGTNEKVTELLRGIGFVIDTWGVSNLKHPDCLSLNLKPALLALKHAIDRNKDTA